MSDCKNYVSEEDIKALKESEIHIEHVARSRNLVGEKVLSVTDTIRGEKVTNRTLDGLEELYQNALSNIGYQQMGDYKPGITIDGRNQIVFENGSWYIYRGDLPHVTSGASLAQDGGIWSEENPNGQWVDVGQNSWRSELGIITKTYNTVADLRIDENVSVGSTVSVKGFHSIGLGASDWVKTSEIVEPNKSPVDLGEFAISDAMGYKYKLIENLANGITIEQLGALPYDNTNPSVRYDLSPLWLLIMKVQKERAPRRVDVRFENRSYYTSKGMLVREWTSFRASGKYGVQMFVGTELYTEEEVPHSSMGGNTTWYSLQTFQLGVVHDKDTFPRGICVDGIDFVTASGFHTDYGLYTPYLTDSEIRSCRFVGNNIGHEIKNIYSNEFDRLLFTARTNTTTKSGAYSLRAKERSPGIGTGTSNIFNRCGYTDYTLGFLIEGLAYSALITCYTEGTLSESIGVLTKKCLGVSFIQWGCERLKSKQTDIPLFRVSNSIVNVSGLNMTWNIDANNNRVIQVDDNSVVSISGINTVGVINIKPKEFIVTDNTSEVMIGPVKYPDDLSDIKNANTLGLKTTMLGSGGNTGTENNVVMNSYEFNNANSKVNTQGKSIGVAKWDRQKFKYVYSVGSEPTDAWMNADGSVAYIPGL